MSWHPDIKKVRVYQNYAKNNLVIPLVARNHWLDGPLAWRARLQAFQAIAAVHLQEHVDDIKDL